MKLDMLVTTRREIATVARHYESLRVGLAERIVTEVESKLAHIRQYPAGYQFVSFQLRRVELSAVPHQLFYAVVNDVIPILGFVPAKMNPNAIHRMMKVRLTDWQLSEPRPIQN